MQLLTNIQALNMPVVLEEAIKDRQNHFDFGGLLL